MPLWFWLNVPLMVALYTATAGIPLWLVLRRWNETTGQAATGRSPHRRQAQPQPSADRPSRPREPQLTH